MIPVFMHPRMSTVTAISGNGSIVSLIVEDVGDEGHVDEARPRGDVGPEVMEMHRYGVRGAIAGDITERLSLFATLRYHEEDGPNDYWGRETNGNNLKYPDTRVNSFNGEHYRVQ